MEDKATQTPVNETAQTTDTTREYPAMTMEDVLSTEVQYKEPQRGDVVNGTVVFISSEGIHVDVGAKVEGVILKVAVRKSDVGERFVDRGDAVDRKTESQ